LHPASDHARHRRGWRVERAIRLAVEIEAERAIRLAGRRGAAYRRSWRLWRSLIREATLDARCYALAVLHGLRHPLFDRHSPG
jgi:hypothetical protein